MVHNCGAAETAVASTLAASGLAAWRRLSCGLGEICPFLTKRRPRSNNFMVAPSRESKLMMKKCSGGSWLRFLSEGIVHLFKGPLLLLSRVSSQSATLQTSSSPSSHWHSGFRSSWPSWHASNQPDAAAEAICNAVVNSRVWPSTVARVWVIISARVRGLSRQV